MSAAGFLDAIRSEPDDMSHRLIFADWLDDHGEESRAEFIRLQIHRDGLDPADPAHRACLRREAELLRAHQTAWISETGLTGVLCRFRRGFIEEVTLDGEDFLSRGPDLFAKTPIRAVRLRHLHALGRLVAASRDAARLYSDLISRVRELAFIYFYALEEHMLPLLHVTTDCELESLQLGQWNLSGEAHADIFSAPLFSTLARLDVGVGGLSAEGLDRFLHAPSLTRLRHLRLTQVRSGPPIVAGLLGSPLLERLRSLSLCHAAIDAGSIDQLVDSPKVRDLEGLELAFNDLGVGGLSNLLASPNLVRLRTLNLSRARIGDGGAAALAKSAMFARLRAIDLSMNHLGDAGGLALADADDGQLGTLDLIYNPLGEEARDALRHRFGEEVCLFRR